MIKEKTMWQTSDGKLHNDADTAQEYEDLLNTMKEFPDIYGRVEGCRICYNDFIDWVKQEKKYCANLFRTLLQTVLKDY